jgi:hypothetical protein
MPSFSGRVAANRHARAFFAAQRDLIFAQERPNVLESDGSFVDLDAVEFGNGVHQVRGRHAARCSKLVAARLQQVIETPGRECGSAKRMSRRDRRCRSGPRRRRLQAPPAPSSPRTAFLQKRKIVFGWVRPFSAVEQHVALARMVGHGDAVLFQDAVEPTGAASVERVANEIAFGLGAARRSGSSSSVARSKPRADATALEICILHLVQRRGSHPAEPPRVFRCPGLSSTRRRSAFRARDISSRCTPRDCGWR